MNLKEAEKIVWEARAPGSIPDIADLNYAKGYLEAYEKAGVLKSGLERMSSFTNGFTFQIYKETLDEWAVDDPIFPIQVYWQLVEFEKGVDNLVEN